MRKLVLVMHTLAWAFACLLAATPANAQQAFADVGKQPPITILINSSPWYGGFEKTVELYEKQTGNKVKLDTTPYNGVLEKARNAVRGDKSPYDLINLDTQWTIEFYEGGFLTPLKDIDPTFDLPKEVLTYGDSGYWNAAKRWRTPSGGKLMAWSPNGNVDLFLYREDMLKEAGLVPPKTWSDVLASCTKLQDPPKRYAVAIRGERGNGIRFEWMFFMLGQGASVVKDAENGDYTVTINSPQAKAALDLFIDVQKRCGPPNAGALGQGDVIQLLATGKAAQAMVVSAAWANFDDPTKSAVVGKIMAVPVPAPVGGKPPALLGNWNMAVPKNIPEAQKKAALAFSRWFLTAGAQRAYAEAGSIPVRSDTFQELGSNPRFRWMPAYLAMQTYAVQELGYAEGAQVEQVLGLRLNQALIGEMSSGKALNTAAKEIEEIFRKNGRRTGSLPPLPE
ncbi:MAG TPA: extracellular solute-binding protein [Casimicrobiaceae bacterium]|nr:extracellular solute-binding protein [Casimicrobiaceae bacterium]